MQSLVQLFWENKEQKAHKGVWWGIAAMNNAKKANKQNSPRVFLTGGSAAHSFFAEMKGLQNVPGVSIYQLFVPKQLLFDKLIMADQIKDNGKPAILVLALHPVSLSYDSPEQIVRSRYFTGAAYRYGVKSPMAEEFYLAHDWEYSPPLSWRINKSANQVLTLLLGAITFKLSMDRDELQALVGNQPLPPPQGNARLKHMEMVAEGFNPKGLQLGMAIIDKLAQVCKNKNIKLVLFELPLSKGYLRTTSKIMDRYHASIEKLLKKYPSIKYCTIPHELHHGSEYLFEDGIHFTPEAGAFFDPLFIRLLQECILPSAGEKNTFKTPKRLSQPHVLPSCSRLARTNNN